MQSRDLPKFVRPRTRPEKLFIRFGPWSAWSRNGRTRQLEVGVSVCPAVLNDDGSVSLDHARCLLPRPKVNESARCLSPASQYLPGSRLTIGLRVDPRRFFG